MTKYRHTPEMGEISGTDGGYEKCCQDMLEAGCKYLDEHPDMEIKVSGFQGVFGIVYPDNDDTAELIKVILKASESSPGVAEATGAQIHQIIMILIYVKQHGWDAYVEQTIKNESMGDDQDE